MLRQEVYALDSSSKAAYPYSVAEQKLHHSSLAAAGWKTTMPSFFTYACEALTCHLRAQSR